MHSLKLAFKFLGTILMLCMLAALLEITAGLWVPPGIATLIALAIWRNEVRAELRAFFEEKRS